MATKAAAEAAAPHAMLQPLHPHNALLSLPLDPVPTIPRLPRGPTLPPPPPPPAAVLVPPAVPPAVPPVPEAVVFYRPEAMAAAAAPVKKNSTNLLCCEERIGSHPRGRRNPPINTYWNLEKTTFCSVSCASTNKIATVLVATLDWAVTFG